MQSGETEVIQPIGAEPNAQEVWFRRLLAAGALALNMAVVLAGCGSAEPVTYAPYGANYYLNADDPYYRHVQETIDKTPDDEGDSKHAKTNMERLLKTPTAQWLTGPIENVLPLLDDTLKKSSAEGTLPVFVLYNIANRDLNGQSGGGTSDATSYMQWVSAVSEKIGDYQAVVIVEPDALASVPQLPDEAQRQARLSTLRNTLQTFNQHNHYTAVYLDAGHSKWQSATSIAELLKQVDPKGVLVHSISLNVANQRPDLETINYADAIEVALGRKLKVMFDGAMNGTVNGPEGTDWCNPPGEKMGALDDVSFDPKKHYVKMFIKPPGESDGVCGTSSAPAGTFDGSLLVKQATP